MMLASIDSNLGKLADLWGTAEALMAQEHKRAITEAGLLLQRELADASPGGATGFYRRAHNFAGPIQVGQDYVGVVGNPLNYAVPVELGTKPHFPPIAPLLDWVETVLGLDGSEAEQVAYAIAWKIKHKGTEGQFVYRDTFAANEHRVAQIMQRATDRVLEKLSHDPA
ncbi:hypothetical protein [Bowmanella denitrificans]|uniref:hypothetical protein n=1 Tax=Bowmanella denitrificans TaxID=366582 RepID=UPI0011AFCEFF|nr:hypothetical protein [Bowmanella denitrificans]